MGRHGLCATEKDLQSPGSPAVGLSRPFLWVTEAVGMGQPGVGATCLERGVCLEEAWPEAVEPERGQQLGAVFGGKGHRT